MAWVRPLTMAAIVGLSGIGVLLTLPRPPVAATASALTAERSATPAGMVYVPGGDFLMGSDAEDADDELRPQHRVSVPSFYIDRTEVTNQEYARFDPTHTYPKGEENLPATSITYTMAEGYAKWAGKRLPTEAEWEKAARGTDGRVFPWGNTWDKTKGAARTVRPGEKAAPVLQKKANSCTLGPSRVRPVGSVPGGVSPYGAVDMAGNAWEWVQGLYNGNPNQRILRGGAVGYGERACRTYERGIEGAGST